MYPGVFRFLLDCVLWQICKLRRALITVMLAEQLIAKSRCRLLLEEMNVGCEEIFKSKPHIRIIVQGDDWGPCGFTLKFSSDLGVLDI